MDEIPLPTILVAPGGDPPPAAPPPFEHEAQLQRVLARLRSPPRTAGAALLLVGSLAVFVLLQGGGSSRLRDIAVLVGVLLLHESGHWLGMKLLGWRDVRMFFIPFFGAATTGRQTEASGWKEGVVLLLGPAPGIVLGTALAFSPAVAGPALRSAAMMLLVVNAFNLLPIGPLDGGRLLQLTLFQRNRHLELGFLAVAGVLLLAAAFALGAWVLGVLGAFTLLGVPFEHRLLRAAHDLRSRGVSLPADPGALEGEPARATFLAAWDVLASSRRADPAMASTMERLVRLASRRPPSVGATLGLLAAGGFAFLLALVGAIALAARHWV